MKSLLAWSRRIDALTTLAGRGSSWLVLAMTLVGAYNAVARYLGRFLGVNLSSNAYIELQWYMFSLVFLLGAAHALDKDSHVRVDVLYGRLSRRAKAWIDLAGTLLFLLPFSLFALWVSWPSVKSSWQVLETSPDPGGLARYPIKSMVLVCFFLLALQAVSELIKLVAVLRNGDGAETPEARA
jgi:TRAP-type mannitol/chloroaromatic compound transport system permease small subunit